VTFLRQVDAVVARSRQLIADSRRMQDELRSTADDYCQLKMESADTVLHATRRPAAMLDAAVPLKAAG
jgi:hypothetical protein